MIWKVIRRRSIGRIFREHVWIETSLGVLWRNRHRHRICVCVPIAHVWVCMPKLLAAIRWRSGGAHHIRVRKRIVVLLDLSHRNLLLLHWILVGLQMAVVVGVLRRSLKI